MFTRLAYAFKKKEKTFCIIISEHPMKMSMFLFFVLILLVLLTKFDAAVEVFIRIHLNKNCGSLLFLFNRSLSSKIILQLSSMRYDTFRIAMSHENGWFIVCIYARLFLGHFLIFYHQN